MRICPAILTNNEAHFSELLRSFQIFEEIDIDLIIPGNLTPEKKTVGIEFVINEISRFQSKRYKIHLMCDFPFEEIRKVIDKVGFLDLTFIIHQESSFDMMDVEKCKTPIGIALEFTTKLKDIYYYENFALVQIMTVEIGGQGNAFEPKAMNKVTELRDLGYDRDIEIDGGINLDTISYIAKFPIDILSVGSYFTKSLNVLEDKRLLEDEIELILKK